MKKIQAPPCWCSCHLGRKENTCCGQCWHRPEHADLRSGNENSHIPLGVTGKLAKKKATRVRGSNA